MLEFVRIAWSTLLLKNFLSVAKNLTGRMINEGGSKQMLSRQIKNAFKRHPELFQKYHIMASGIVSNTETT